MTEMRFADRSGYKLAFTARGSGMPVLFIQGVGVHGNGWLPQIDNLCSSCQCVTFDNRGLGQSEAIPHELSIEQMADDALAVLDAMGWLSAHIVGHSMGGQIALQLSLSARPRIRSLALLCTFANGLQAAPMTPRMVCLGLRTQIGTRRMRRRAFLRLVMPPSALAKTDRNVLAEQLASLFGHDLADQPPIVSKQLKAMRAFDASNRLKDLTGLPTLVVSGTHDPIAPPKLGRKLADGIPEARFVEMHDASHGAPIQFADKINELLREHIAAAERPSNRHD